MNIGEKWREIVERTRREGIAERVETEAKAPDPNEVLLGELGGWASDERARKAFVPWLEQEMEKAVLAAHRSRQTPTEQNYVLGIEAGLRFVRDRLRRWASGQP
jgi:hypothetical protein